MDAVSRSHSTAAGCSVAVAGAATSLLLVLVMWLSLRCGLGSSHARTAGRKSLEDSAVDGRGAAVDLDYQLRCGPRVVRSVGL